MAIKESCVADDTNAKTLEPTTEILRESLEDKQLTATSTLVAIMSMSLVARLFHA